MDGEPLTFYEMATEDLCCKECGQHVSGFEPLPGAVQIGDDGGLVIFTTDGRVLPCGHLSGLELRPVPTAAELRAAEGLDFS